MTPAEQNCHVGEQELLAVVHALELWRCYLDGTEFTVVTDYTPDTFFEPKSFCRPSRPGGLSIFHTFSSHGNTGLAE